MKISDQTLAKLFLRMVGPEDDAIVHGAAAVFGISGEDLHRIAGDARNGHHFDRLEEFRRHVGGHAALPHAMRRDRILRLLPSGAAVDIHPIAADFLAADDLDPIDVALIAAWAGEGENVAFEVRGDQEIVARLLPGNRLDVAADLDENGQWYEEDDGSVIETHLGRTIPETVAASLAGRLLTELLRHPILDRHPLRIRNVTNPDDATAQSLRIALLPLD